MYDIAIIGAGPAGSILARQLNKKYKVAILDKRNLDENHIYKNTKCCGGLLAPDAQKMLATLGLGIPKNILVDPQLFTVKTIDLCTKKQRHYQRHYYNMDREAFDRWLVSQIPETVTTYFSACYKGYSALKSGYQINYVKHNQTHTLNAKIIVGADGALSKVRRQLYSQKDDPKLYIAIQKWYEYYGDTPYYTAIFDKEISDFYAWTIPKNNYIMLGAALAPNPDAPDKFRRLKDKLADYNLCLGQELKTEGAHLYRPRALQAFKTRKHDIVLIGEAAGAISPSSAEGISYALKTGNILAAAINADIVNFRHVYNAKSGQIRLNLVGKMLKSPIMYQPILRKLAMASGLTSVEMDKACQRQDNYTNKKHIISDW